jgi:hypothetical protein
MNIENLKRLREHIQTINPDTFKMRTFSADQYEVYGDCEQDAIDHNWCGTSACLVGHMTTIEPLTVDEVSVENGGIFVDFVVYSYRVFDMEEDIDDSVWKFLFETEWSNDIDHAIKRLDYVIEHGEEPFDFIDEETGDQNYDWN